MLKVLEQIDDESTDECLPPISSVQLSNVIPPETSTSSVNVSTEVINNSPQGKRTVNSTLSQNHGSPNSSGSRMLTR